MIMGDCGPLETTTNVDSTTITRCAICKEYFNDMGSLRRHIHLTCYKSARWMTDGKSSPPNSEHEDTKLTTAQSTPIPLSLPTTSTTSALPSAEEGQSTLTIKVAEYIEKVESSPVPMEVSSVSNENASNPCASETQSTDREKQLHQKTNTQQSMFLCTNLSEARVFGKSIHPVRICGPCFSCKKPSKARIYCHLQLRSENFVQFVMARCKNISLQSCICKACELNFTNMYKNKKRRVERHAGAKKSLSFTRSVANKSPADSTLRGSKTSTTAINKKPFGKTHKSTSQRVDGPSTSSISSCVSCSLKRCANQLVGTEEVTKQAVPAPSEDMVKEAHHSTEVHNNEKKAASSNDGETRRQVLLEFAKMAPLMVSGRVGRRSSLAQIIDAVTQRVKEDPSLAETLTKAINAAASSGSDSEELTRQTRYKAKGVAVRESVSLPSVLDGFVAKVNFPFVNAAPSNGDTDLEPAAQSSIDLPATDVKTIMPPPSRPIDTKKSSQPVANINKSLKEQTMKPTSLCAPANAVYGGVTVSGETGCPLGQLRMAKPVKRASTDSISNSFRSTHGPPKAKYMMTGSTYRRIVNTIDAVACGDIQPSSFQHLDEPVSPVTSEASSGLLNGPSHNLMYCRDNLECITSADHPYSTSTSSIGSGVSSSLLSNPTNDFTHSSTVQPMKDLRLANIISKLSAYTDIGKTKASLPATSPTISCLQNPNSIHSGFVSFAE